MTEHFTPEALKAKLPTGLLSFPVTDFTPSGDLDVDGYRRRLEWLSPYGTATLFAAGGTGEYFSCLLYTSPSPRDRQKSRMPSSA